jgi:hypothetical protein
MLNYLAVKLQSKFQPDDVNNLLVPMNIIAISGLATARNVVSGIEADLFF